MLIYRNNRITRFKCTFLVLSKLGKKELKERERKIKKEVENRRRKKKERDDKTYFSIHIESERKIDYEE